MVSHVYRSLVFSLLALLALTRTALGAAEFRPDRVIVRFQHPMTTESFRYAFDSDAFALDEVLVPDLDLYTVKLHPGVGVEAALMALNWHNEVRYAQPDHFVRPRSLPNDPLFGQQWALHNKAGVGEIHAPEAWDLGTGGKDKAGNDVVIALIDTGIDLTHKELKDNLWTNPGEIAGNGIDDDGNGYIDDVHGWNAYDENGDIPSAEHGTHVAGIVGASGNNGSLVTGVNWNTKIMAIAGSSDSTSVVAKAYGYVIAQKQAWLKSGGKEGANVVVTNSSFGVDKEKCDAPEFRAWNDLYNEMGKQGILSVVATVNDDVDVDKEGDVPSACNSPFIVAVTNTTAKGEKYTGINDIIDGVAFGGAGYGAKHVHLGAPGVNILSTIPGNKVGAISGTSMSAPFVSGAVGFLHSVADKKFNDYYLSQPEAAAMELKAILLKTVDSEATLKNVTVTGGRLNLFSAAKAMSIY